MDSQQSSTTRSGINTRNIQITDAAEQKQTISRIVGLATAGTTIAVGSATGSSSISSADVAHAAQVGQSAVENNREIEGCASAYFVVGGSGCVTVETNDLSVREIKGEVGVEVGLKGIFKQKPELDASTRGNIWNAKGTEQKSGTIGMGLSLEASWQAAIFGVKAEAKTGVASSLSSEDRKGIPHENSTYGNLSIDAVAGTSLGAGGVLKGSINWTFKPKNQFGLIDYCYEQRKPSKIQ